MGNQFNKTNERGINTFTEISNHYITDERGINTFTEIPYKFPNYNIQYYKVHDLYPNDEVYNKFKNIKWNKINFYDEYSILCCIINGKLYLKPFNNINNNEFKQIFNFDNDYEPNKIIGVFY